jgi:hypothetical protein
MIRLSTLLMGPQAGGRGYRVLASCDLPKLDPAAAAILNALPLVLAGWADTGEAQFAARIPLGEAAFPAMLLRARLVGQAVGGSIAYAQGVIATQADAAVLKGAVEAILPAIPMPDGSTDFAAQLLDVEPGASMNAFAHPWAGLGLAWRDRLLLVPDAVEAEPLALSAIAALEPTEQRSRIRGWATTGALRASGPFTPMRAFQLIAIGPGQARPGSHYLPATVTPAGFNGDQVSAPPTWQTWQRIQALGDGEASLGPAVARLGWSPQSAELTPHVLAKMAARAIHGAISDDNAAVWRLILRMTGKGQDPALVEAARELLCALIDTEPLPRAIALTGLWQRLPGEARSLLGPLDARLVSRTDIADLSGEWMDRALDLGAARALANTGVHAEVIVDGADATWLGHILGNLIEEPDWTANDAALVSRILLRLDALGVLVQEPEAAYFAVGIGRCLDWTDVPAVTAVLLRATITDAMLARASNLAQAYTKALLHLPRAISTHDEQQLRVVQAMVSMVRAASGKAAHETM